MRECLRSIDFPNMLIYNVIAIEYYKIISAIQSHSAWVKENQVQVLSDPVTVSGERSYKSPLRVKREKA